MVDAKQLCFLCPWTHARCYTNASWRGGDGVGMVTFFELAHMVDAKQLCFLCSWTHARCYTNASWRGGDGVGMVTFFELAHMVDATQVCFLCPWAHARCYTNASWWGGDGVGMVTFFELAHMVDATQLCFLCPWMMNKDREHSTMHPSVSQYVFMWCWRCSSDSADPQRFLEELEKLLWQKENVPLCCC